MRFEIHSHSIYSNLRLIDCINNPKDLIQRAADLGLSGIALTDHESLSGHVDWLEAEKELKEQRRIPEEFVCALGDEIYLIDDRKKDKKFWHFILIAKNEQGHRALREISSTAWYNLYNYRGMERVPITKQELTTIVRKYPGSLIASSACLGSEVAHLTLELIELEKTNDKKAIYDKKIEILNFCNFCRDLFGEDFYLEVAPSASKDQVKYNKRIKDIARGLGIKLVFGGDAHYLSANEREIHKAFLNSKNGEREVDDFYYYAYLMDDEEAFQNCGGVFSVEEFEEICVNSLEIQNKIKHYDLNNSPIIPFTDVKIYPKKTNPHLEKYQTLYKLLLSDDKNERYWINECLSGLKNIEKSNDDAYLARLEEEADVIRNIGKKINNNLFAYFNTFQSYIDLFWECGSIVGPGRGSAVCFLSNYLLGITQLDPLDYNLPSFRFLNKDRAELPDIDIDLAPSKRPRIFQKIREQIGETNLLQVATFTTIAPRAAILTACRGYRSAEFPEGIDIDVAHYISSLIPSERGITWTISEMLYGNEEKDRKPNQTFINEINKYPGLLDIVKRIEGLISTRSTHASGVIIYNNSCCETGALMRSPGGDLITQFSLHQAEKCGDVKFDFLLTEICDRLISTIQLLQRDSLLPQMPLREVYNKYLHPKSLNIEDEKIWSALGQGNILDIFQFSTQVGLQAATSIKPKNPTEMMMANALTRLVGEKGQERPIERYIRLRDDMSQWYEEVNEYGLTKEEIKKIEPFYLPTSGCPTTQEKLMLICMNVANFSLKDANLARKIVAKKKISEVPKLKEKFISGCNSENLAEYVWKTCMAPQMSYSFAEPHALAYSFVGIQTLYLATSYPEIYWDCACLISDSGGAEEIDGDYDENEDDIEDEEENEAENEDVINTKRKQKKKADKHNYGKIAAAIGKMNMAGIKVSPPDINKSSFTFTPDVKTNSIRFGLSGITSVGKAIIKDIIENRPYQDLKDFMSKIKLSKPKMVNLIKSGAFDSIGDKNNILSEYINEVADKKKRVTLQNMKMLIDFNLIPEKYDRQKRFYNFTKYIKKKEFKDADILLLDNIAYKFYEKNCDFDDLSPNEKSESGFAINKDLWEKKYYKKEMDIIRPWVKEHSEELKDKINERLYQDLWNKYCDGTNSKWEMDSVSCYFKTHELEDIDEYLYNCEDFFSLPEEPQIEKTFKKNNRVIPLYKITRIMGTVLDRDKTKKTVTLLTKNGIVVVKIYGDAFTNYDKQISVKNPITGKKTIVERSWLKRGNKIIVTGIRRGSNEFVCKKYKSTPYHMVELITKINDDGTLETKTERDEIE